MPPSPNHAQQSSSSLQSCLPSPGPLARGGAENHPSSKEGDGMPPLRRSRGPGPRPSLLILAGRAAILVGSQADMRGLRRRDHSQLRHKTLPPADSRDEGQLGPAGTAPRRILREVGVLDSARSQPPRQLCPRPRDCQKVPLTRFLQKVKRELLPKRRREERLPVLALDPRGRRG